MRIPHLPAVNVQRIQDSANTRTALVVSVPLAWQAVGASLLGISHTRLVWCTDATTIAWEHAIGLLHHHDFAVIYAVSGGLAVDMTKYIAYHFTIPLSSIPTALSVDTFRTPASGIRCNGCGYYIPTKAPDTLILVLTLMAQAPAPIRAVGITDVLSIATGAWDWQYAHEHGQNPTHMSFVANTISPMRLNQFRTWNGTRRIGGIRHPAHGNPTETRRCTTPRCARGPCHIPLQRLSQTAIDQTMALLPTTVSPTICRLALPIYQ